MTVGRIGFVEQRKLLFPTVFGTQLTPLRRQASAAEQLRDQAGAPTDTLAKLCWHLDQGTTHPNLPRIDEGTLVGFGTPLFDIQATELRAATVLPS